LVEKGRRMRRSEFLAAVPGLAFLGRWLDGKGQDAPSLGLDTPARPACGPLLTRLYVAKAECRAMYYDDPVYFQCDPETLDALCMEVAGLPVDTSVGFVGGHQGVRIQGLSWQYTPLPPPTGHFTATPWLCTNCADTGFKRQYPRGVIEASSYLPDHSAPSVEPCQQCRVEGRLPPHGRVTHVDYEERAVTIDWGCDT